MTGLLIRDALAKDVDACMALDHQYETEHVWQMAIQQTGGGWQIAFKTQRLPRKMEVEYPADARRLHLCLSETQCFLVAVDRETDEVFGYLTMRMEPVRRTAWVQDIVVDRAYRHQGIGSRLIKIARQWALEHDALRLMVETRTKNYPAIQFCTHSGLMFCGYNDHYLEDQDIAVFFGQTLA